MGILRWFFRFPEYVRSSFILIRVGRGAGISVYKLRADENILRRAASYFFKTAFRMH